MEVEGEVEPYCQPHHHPHPPIEQLTDRKYFAKLEAISSAIADPLTGQEQLNNIVELILDTGNFSTTRCMALYEFYIITIIIFL